MHVYTCLFKIKLEVSFFLGLDTTSQQFKKFSIAFPFGKGTLHILEVTSNADISFHSTFIWETPVIVWMRELIGILSNMLQVVDCYPTSSQASMFLIKDDITLCQILEQEMIIKGPTISFVEDKLCHSCS